MGQTRENESSDELYKPVTGGNWRKKDSAPSLEETEEKTAADNYESPFPDTAVADESEKYTRNEEFSERLDDQLDRPVN